MSWFSTGQFHTAKTLFRSLIQGFRSGDSDPRSDISLILGFPGHWGHLGGMRSSCSSLSDDLHQCDLKDEVFSGERIVHIDGHCIPSIIG